MDKYISKFGGTKEKRILIVTDTVLTGSSLSVLVAILKENGYIPDIATIGVVPPVISNSPKQNLPDTEIISGEYKNKNNYKNTPLIYRAQHLSGVYKLRGDIKSQVFDRDMQGHVKPAREDSKKMIDKLVNWYQEIKNE